MNNIPIFDSLTHPMPDGNWLHPRYEGVNTVSNLTAEMKSANVGWALAVGMGKEIGSYEEDKYASFIRSQADNLLPIAYVKPGEWVDKSTEQLRGHLSNLITQGYIGIKLHPRFGQFTFCDDIVSVIIREAAALQLTVLLCTYCWETSARAQRNDPFSMMKMLSTLEGAPVVLLHGGGVLLMQYIEIARSFTNVLLDLSLTLCKYEGSSVDMDLAFAFAQFDRRICIGSDGPEFKSADLRRRYNQFAAGIDEQKQRNIAYKNLQNFIPLVDF